jgi:Ca-activated chloride channel family protein
MKPFLFTSILVIVCLAFRLPEQREIKGSVTDEQGRALAGVTVTEKGTAQAVLTDAAGKFSIKVNSSPAVLVFSLAGYTSREITVGKATTVQVVLASAGIALNEVVVTGYNNVQHRKNGPGAAAPSALAKMRTSSSPGMVLQDGARWRYNHHFNTESYGYFTDNPFQKVKDAPLSTFSIDVDAASYSNIRRIINSGQLPPAGAVRIEEMINYFHYNYPQPNGDAPFAVHTELAGCPWNPQHRLLMVGLQGKKIPYENLPASNLVFLVDVSGSMMQPGKLPLVQSSLKLLTEQLRPQDRVALVAYAGNAGLVLPSTEGSEKQKIKDAIDALEAGGSTAGGAGIQLAYKIARQQLVKNGNNRVILCTDGDFNVGASSEDELVRLIEQEKESGVYLTVLGYGSGNYQDSKMQQLADKGNGNHVYIDGIGEARKILMQEFGGTLFTIAKDVKLQLEFNPAHIQGYRLIGYENRVLAKEDFNNDRKDAGEMGSGHTVTALYELIPQGVPAAELDSVDALRYQAAEQGKKTPALTGELLHIKLRYKQPGGDKSRLLEHTVTGYAQAFEKASSNLRFAAAVAAFGMQLRSSPYKGHMAYDDIIHTARAAMDEDKENYRGEFVQLVARARDLAGEKEAQAVHPVSVHP